MNSKELVKKVSKEFNIDISKRSRRRDFVYARAVYYKISRDVLNNSLSEIGARVGVGHATVLHSINNVFPIIERFEPSVMYSYNKLKEKVMFELESETEEYVDVNKLKSEIVELKYQLREAKKQISEKERSTALDDLIERIPEDKIELVRVRLDAMIKML